MGNSFFKVPGHSILFDWEIENRLKQISSEGKCSHSKFEVFIIYAGV